MSVPKSWEKLCRTEGRGNNETQVADVRAIRGVRRTARQGQKEDTKRKNKKHKRGTKHEN